MNKKTPARDLKRIAQCAKVMLVRETGTTPARKIHGPADVYDICAPLIADAAQEHFLVLTLDTQHSVRTIHTVTVGTLDTSLVSPREVFLRAIVDAAAAIIIVHNHPSGDPSPTREDRDVTDALRAGGSLLGLPVLDHVVIGSGCYVSFQEQGL